MLQKVLGGTMAIGLAALLSLPALAVARPQQADHTSMQQHQLEPAAKKSSKKKKKGQPSQKPKPTTPAQQSLYQGQQQSVT
jgi:hypothetical protein